MSVPMKAHMRRTRDRANTLLYNQTNMSDKTGNEHNLIVRIETDEYIYEEYSEA